MLSTGHFFKTQKLGLIGIEFFLKEMQNLTRYGDEELIDISENSNWESQIPVGEGRAYGMEVTLNKSYGKTNFNLAYTLSWSDRQFDQLNNGDRFRFRFDRRHILHASIVHKINPNLDFAVNWQYASGTPVTMPSGARYFEYSENGTDPTVVLVYEGINNAMLPDYHRLDFGFNFRNNYSWGSSVFTIGLYNVYNRQNAFYREVVVDLADPISPIRFEDVTILPVLPTLSYNISF